jgi:hypothetical protein
MGIRNGFASAAWGRYDPHPPKGFIPKVKLRLIHSAPSVPDPMCDWIEEAEWWMARSDRSVRQIQNAFERSEMACLLYERVGAMKELGRQGRQYRIAIQLVRIEPSWDLDISLSDSQIYLDELLHGGRGQW